ncbi:hypothetical protein LXA43DRAFT_975273 [Ganoderma leucocontextum]|nr:hypothetical protein LXA43DRAFT_975273 [Ganoderma leucocontextum]
MGEVDAGTHLTPNALRLFYRWTAGPFSVQSRFKISVVIVLRGYNTGERVGHTQLASMKEKHGAPYYHFRRADLPVHKTLYDPAAPFMTLCLNSTVVEVDPDAPFLTLASMEVVHGDLVVGADGIMQQMVLIIGDAAHRIMIPSQLLLEGRKLKKLVEVPEMLDGSWPAYHGIQHRTTKEHSLALFLLNDGSVEAWRTSAITSPDLPRKICIHPSSRVVLLADAYHPISAAMVIEDAAVLGNLLSLLSHPKQLSVLLQAYQNLRLPHTANAQHQLRLNQKVFPPDGPEQEQRDADMHRAAELELGFGRVVRYSSQRRH